MILVELLISHLKVGLLAFGGGNAAISLLQAEAVPRWLSAEEFAELVGLNFALPGVTIVKLAALIGLRAAGVAGMMVAACALVAPGLVLTGLAASLVARHRQHELLRRALLALQLGAVALLASATLKLLPGWPRLLPACFLLGTFAAVHLGSVPPALALVGAVAAGLLLL